MKMSTSNTERYWFLFYNNQILLHKSGQSFDIPYASSAPAAYADALDVNYSDHVPAVAARLNAPFEETDEYVMSDLRQSYYILSEKDYLKSGKASQLLYWDAHSHFCPACGAAMTQTTPITKKCPHCGFELYPTIATAIIVLIHKGDKILLVHAKNFRHNFKGLVAGFLEVGETLEECVYREVMEETGLTIANVRYFDNQPWPYPSGLMVGFTADYVSGSIKLQEEELSDADFFSRDELPEIPGKMSMARRLIDAWLAEKA